MGTQRPPALLAPDVTDKTVVEVGQPAPQAQLMGGLSHALSHAPMQIKSLFDTMNWIVSYTARTRMNPSLFELHLENVYFAQVEF